MEHDVIPEGTYSALIDGYGTIRSQRSGTLQYRLTFKVATGPHAGAEVSQYGDLTGDKARFTFANLKALGFDGEDPRLAEFDVARPVTIDVKHKASSNGGKPFVNVYVRSPRKSVDMSEAEVREIVSAWRAFRTKVVEAPPLAAVTSDEIPF